MGLLSKNKNKTKTSPSDSDTTTTTPDYSAKLVLLGDSSVGKTSLALRFVNGSFHPFQEPTIGASFLSKTLRVDPSASVLFPMEENHIASSIVNAEEDNDDGEMESSSSPESSSSSSPLSRPSENVSSSAAAINPDARSPTATKSVLLKIWDTAGQERYQSLTPLYFRGATAALLVYDVSKFHSYHTLSRWVRELKQFGPPNILLTVVGNKTDLAHEMRNVDQHEAREFAKSIGAVYMETSAKNGINVDEVFQELARRIVVHESSSSSSTTTGVNNNTAVDGAVDLAATADSEYTRSTCC
jgi:small GTP-binding protein